MHSKHRYLLLTIIWFFAIWYISSLPQSQLPGVGDRSSTLAHFLEYSILTLLVARTLDAHDLPFHHHIVVPVFLGMMFLAGADEWHQTLIAGRTPSWTDFSFDAIGIILGFSVYFIMSHISDHWRASDAMKLPKTTVNVGRGVKDYPLKKIKSLLS